MILLNKITDAINVSPKDDKLYLIEKCSDVAGFFVSNKKLGGVTKCMLAQGSVRSLCKRRRRRTPSSASGDSLRSSRFS